MSAAARHGMLLLLLPFPVFCLRSVCLFSTPCVAVGILSYSCFELQLMPHLLVDLGMS